MHPQMPVLLYSEILGTWERVWEPPERGKCTVKGKELPYMVLAIGARVSNAKGQISAQLLDRWTEHSSNKANVRQSIQ